MGSATLFSNVGAENAFISCVLLSPAQLELFLNKVDEDCFTEPCNRKAYAKCLELHGRGYPVNLATLGDDLPLNVDASIDVSHCEAYSKILLESSTRRKCSEAGEAIIRAAGNEKLGVERVVDFSEAAVFGVRSKSSASCVATAEALCSASRKMIESGCVNSNRIGYPWRWLNDMSGGMGDGELIVIGGYSGDGKSVVGLQMLVDACLAGRNVGYWSLEMPSSQVQNRLVAMSGVSLRSIRDNTLTEQGKRIALKRIDVLENMRYDVYTGSTTVSEIRSRQVRNRYDLIIIDHLHRMDTDRKALEKNVRDMKNIALDTNCVVVVLAQLSRRDGFPRPTTTQLRESASVEFEADTVLLLWRQRDDYGFRSNASEIVVGKMRDGESDYSARLTFSPGNMSFMEDSCG